MRYRVKQYLIRKLSDMVKMGNEGLAVAALLISVKAFQKLKIYYISRALSKLNCYAVYLKFKLNFCKAPKLNILFTRLTMNDLHM